MTNNGVPNIPDQSHSKRTLENIDARKENADGSFFKGSVESATNGIINDILIPAAKDAIFNTVTEFFKSLLYGKGNSEPPTRSVMRDRNGNSYTAYNSFSQGAFSKPIGMTTMNRSIYEYQNVEFNSRSSAEMVLSLLKDICDDQGCATVANLYETSGLTPNSTDNNWGWYELPTGIVKVVRKLNGLYRITFPPVVSIRK